jgi:hypothetical protein
LKVNEARGFFPLVSMIWQSPLIHVVTPTKGLVTSQVTMMRVLTKSLCSPYPTWWSSNHEQDHQDLLRASTITMASSEGPRSSRPPRCYQSPRVTSHSLHLSRIEHQVRIHQLNLLPFTWILMTWQVEWWWIMLLVALKIKAIGGAYIDSTSNKAIGEKAVRQKVITPVKPVLLPCYRRFNWWVHFLSFWTSRWRSINDLFQLCRFNWWTQLIRV